MISKIFKPHIDSIKLLCFSVWFQNRFLASFDAVFLVKYVAFQDNYFLRYFSENWKSHIYIYVYIADSVSKLVSKKNLPMVAPAMLFVHKLLLEPHSAYFQVTTILIGNSSRKKNANFCLMYWRFLRQVMA